jgi:hypothetical protein
MKFESAENAAASMSSILREESDGFHVAATLSFRGITKPLVLSGDFQLGQEVAVIDGIAFQRVLSIETMSLPFPMPLVEGTTIRYYNTELNVVFHGEGTYPALFKEPGDDIPRFPVSIHLPTHPDFDNDVPQYDCGQFGMVPASNLNSGDAA